jgi:molybdopterin/thiamine biosynthesis adenylyltransferase
MTGRQHAALVAHLHPGDGLEAAALLLCGRGRGGPSEILVVHRVVPIPHAECERSETHVSWPTRYVAQAVAEAEQRGFALVKAHSHPEGADTFSDRDDASDRAVFEFVDGWMGGRQKGGPHGSLVALPDGRMIGRAVRSCQPAEPIARISVIGDDFVFIDAPGDVTEMMEAHRRTMQTFGRQTTEMLRGLSVAVIGCSGTGSQVIEMLARNGVGELVLVDPERIDEVNLNRITGAYGPDVGRLKVDVLGDSAERMGTGCRAVRIASTLGVPEVVQRVAACDVAFGCMDSIEGRDVLNRLCAFYGVAYLDLGVGLVADGEGGIDRVAGAVHVLTPDGSSLMSRGVYTPDELGAEAMRRADPTQYEVLRREKYIAGVDDEETPAVISVNALVASLAVNEFLARLHPYRIDPNGASARWQVSLEGGVFAAAPEGPPCPLLAPKAGRGDLDPLLDLPMLSEMRPEAAL